MMYMTAVLEKQMHGKAATCFLPEKNIDAGLIQKNRADLYAKYSSRNSRQDRSYSATAAPVNNATLTRTAASLSAE